MIFTGSARIPACWTRSVQKAFDKNNLIFNGGLYAAKRDVARTDACAPSQEARKYRGNRRLEKFLKIEENCATRKQIC